MAYQEKQLAQLHVTSAATATSVLSPAASETLVIKAVLLCNTGTTAILVRLFQDNDGVVYDKTTALLFDRVISGNGFILIDSFLPMNNSSGNLAIECDTANVLTITVGGSSITP